MFHISMRKESIVFLIHESNFTSPLCRYNKFRRNTSIDRWILPKTRVNLFFFLIGVLCSLTSNELNEITLFLLPFGFNTCNQIFMWFILMVSLEG